MSEIILHLLVHPQNGHRAGPGQRQESERHPSFTCAGAQVGHLPLIRRAQQQGDASQVEQQGPESVPTDVGPAATLQHHTLLSQPSYCIYQAFKFGVNQPEEIFKIFNQER